MATNQRYNLEMTEMRQVNRASLASDQRRLSFSGMIASNNQQSSEPYCEIDILSECCNNLSRIGIHHSKSTNGSLSCQSDRSCV